MEGSQMIGTVRPMPVLISAASTALASSAIAIAVNLATEWKTNMVAWIAVAVLTLVATGIATWTQLRQTASDTDSRSDTHLSVENSVIGRDNVQIGRANDVNINGKRS
jgi:hypothetical protein